MSQPFPSPPLPELPDDHVATASFELRYEDLAQDGRMMMTALPPALGWTVWRQLLAKHPARGAAENRGIVSILTRLTVDGTDATIRVDRPVEATGAYQIARQAESGERLFMNMWVEVRGAQGRMVPPQGPGPNIVAGRLFAEHTFTRLFAPPDKRRVSPSDVRGVDDEPIADYAFPGADTAMQLPDGATALDDAYVPDEAEICFGLDHTDSNQHVNSLVYPRLFAEAALRRFATHKRKRDVLVRHLDIAYRKPSFAGDRVRVHVRAFTLGDRAGVAGWLAADGEAKPRCAARILFG
ncbi:MAG TPA: hotdog domain-containing protein [Kofleriaceae bacterium]|nr:hotdog domain-containing protein [Kofleriaceae bacterium]